MNLETDSKLFLTEEETRDFLAAETAKAKRAQPLKPGTLDMIVEHVRHAREKHPDWRKTQDYVVSVASSSGTRFATRWRGSLASGRRKKLSTSSRSWCDSSKGTRSEDHLRETMPGVR